MAISTVQFVISIPLFLVLAFGLGFIFNMVVKTTWMPVFLYLAVAVYLFFDVGRKLSYVDWVILSSGLVGAVASGVVIRELRRRGYRMF